MYLEHFARTKLVEGSPHCYIYSSPSFNINLRTLNQRTLGNQFEESPRYPLGGSLKRTYDEPFVIDFSLFLDDSISLWTFMLSLGVRVMSGIPVEAGLARLACPSIHLSLGGGRKRTASTMRWAAVSDVLPFIFHEQDEENNSTTTIPFFLFQ